MTKEDQAEKILNYALGNLIFYRAKAINFNVKSFQHSEVIMLKPDPAAFPLPPGASMVRFKDRIEPDHIYTTAKILIEQHSERARPDIELHLPFNQQVSYVGLRLTCLHNFPFKVMLGCTPNGANAFNLQLSVQNLDKKLEVLRAELDEWRKTNGGYFARLGRQTTNYTV